MAMLISCADNATSVKTEIPNRKLSDASRNASGWGNRVGSSTPICSFEDRREDRIPPRAPVSSRNAGRRTSRAGNLRKKSCARDSIAVPARMSITPATNRITIDSRMTRRARGRSVNRPRTIPIAQAATAIVPTTSVTTWFPPLMPGLTTRNEAAHRAGSVQVSPIAVTSGADTESRSHPIR